MNIGVITVATKSHLSQARTLFASVARVHPEYQLFLCLTDRVDGHFDPAEEPYTIVEVERLGIPGFGDFALRYDVFEFNCAVKPFLFQWIFDNTALDAVIYLDSDILVYSRFDRLEAILRDGASVALTPHITKPLDGERLPSELTILRSGAFNLGFVAARRCRESLDFMRWWGKHLLTQGVNDQQAGLFVDQRWCDLAPCLLESLAILKDVGYNAAYWNLAERHIASTADGHWTVNGSPLTFFHFSGVDPADKHVISKFQDRFTWAGISNVQPLFEAYNTALMQAGWNETHLWPYAFDAVDGGGAIRRAVRMVYREAHPQPTDVTVGEWRGIVREVCNQPSTDVPVDEGIRITKLMHLLYRSRVDVQSAFAMHTPDGRAAFAGWFEEAGLTYGLSPELTQQQLIGQQQLPPPLEGHVHIEGRHA